MSMELKQALQKFNVVNKVEIYCQSNRKDTHQESEKFERKTLKNEWRLLANTRWTNGTINWISHMLWMTLDTDTVYFINEIK